MKDNNSNDPYSELFKVGKQIGVDIDYSGIYVYSKEIRNIIVLSITETMMNVISHAKGSKLFVKVKKRMMKFQLILKMMESRLKKKL